MILLPEAYDGLLSSGRKIGEQNRTCLKLLQIAGLNRLDEKESSQEDEDREALVKDRRRWPEDYLLREGSVLLYIKWI